MSSPLLASREQRRSSCRSQTTSNAGDTLPPSPIAHIISPILPSVPRICLGTVKVRGEECVRVVSDALRAGYRRIDSATVYRNEAAIGEAVRASDIAREEIFITSKSGPSQMESEETAFDAVSESVSRTQLEYLDCYLLHWPGRGGLKPTDPQHAAHRLSSWRGLERALDAGLVRAIGVSNFGVRHLEGLRDAWRIPPCINQIELHPLIYHTQRHIIEWCRLHAIDVQAYAPLGSGHAELLGHEVVLRIARQSHRTPAQVLLKWSLQHGFLPVAKSRSLDRAKENLRVALDDWTLSAAHLAELDSLEQRFGTRRFCWDSSAIQ